MRNALHNNPQTSGHNRAGRVFNKEETLDEYDNMTADELALQGVTVIGDGQAPQPPYTLDQLKDVAPTEHAVFTHSPALRSLWGHSISRLCSPWGALGAALVRTSVALEPEVVLPNYVGTYGSLNLMVGLVANSGGGKGASESVARDCFMVSKGTQEQVILEKPLGSGEGIAETFTRRAAANSEEEHGTLTRALFTVSEIDKLGALKSRQGATVMETLRQVFSGETIGNTNGNKDTSRNVQAHTYRATLLVGIQPRRSGVLLSTDEVDGGTAQRFLWLPTEPYPLDKRQRPGELSPAVVNLADSINTGERVVIEFPKQVGDHTRQLRIDRLTGKSHDPLAGHRNLLQLKVAAHLAVIGGRTAATMNDWHVADLILQKSDETRLWCLDGLKEVQETEATRRAERALTQEEARHKQTMKRLREQAVQKLGAYGRMRIEGTEGLEQRTAYKYRHLVKDVVAELEEDGLVQPVPYEEHTYYELTKQ